VGVTHHSPAAAVSVHSDRRYRTLRGPRLRGDSSFPCSTSEELQTSSRNRFARAYLVP